MIRRLCFILCGVALTWTCAVFGLFLLGSGQGCGHIVVRAAVRRVREVEQGLAQYTVEHDHCPTSCNELISAHYVRARSFVDPWGNTIAYSCSDEEVTAISAGPDKRFNTADDVTAGSELP